MTLLFRSLCESCSVHGVLCDEEPRPPLWGSPRPGADAQCSDAVVGWRGFGAGFGASLEPVLLSPIGCCAWSREVTHEGRPDPPSLSTQVTPSHPPEKGSGGAEQCWGPDGHTACRASKWFQKRVPAAALKTLSFCTAWAAQQPGHLAAPSCCSLVLFLVWLLLPRPPSGERNTHPSGSPSPLSPLQFLFHTAPFADPVPNVQIRTSTSCQPR